MLFYANKLALIGYAPTDNPHALPEKVLPTCAPGNRQKDVYSSVAYFSIKFKIIHQLIG